EHQIVVVVGRDAIVSLEAAGKATMDEHLLALGPSKRPDRRHQPAAATGPVARVVAIDVTRVKTERAVVTVPPTARRWQHEHATVTATEPLVLGGPAAW